MKQHDLQQKLVWCPVIRRINTYG